MKKLIAILLALFALSCARETVVEAQPAPLNCSSSNASCRASRFVTTGTYRAADGSASAPAFSFSAATNWGMWRDSTGVHISASGLDLLRVNNSSGAVENPSTNVGFSSSAALGTNAFQAVTNGARYDFGAGASDYASSDGTTVTFAGPLATVGSFTSSGQIAANATSTVALTIPNGSIRVGANDGTSGQVLESRGANTVGAWTTEDAEWNSYSTGNLAAAAVINETTFTHARTVTTASKITQNVVGVGAGNFVVKLCTDGATCAGGNTYATWTQACAAAVGTRAAATIQNGGTIPAASTGTLSVTTACATTDPAVNINVHYTTP